MYGPWFPYLISSLLAFALALVAAVAMVRIRRLRARIASQNALLESLERNMQAVCLGAKGMGDAVARLEHKLKKLTERQDQIDMRDPDARVYHHAIALVGKGAGVGDLVSTCGLSREEAELVHLLHQQVRSASERSPAGAAGR